MTDFQCLAPTLQVSAVSQYGQVVYQPVNPTAKTFAALIAGDSSGPLQVSDLTTIRDELGYDIQIKDLVDIPVINHQYAAYRREYVEPKHIKDHA